MAWRMGTGADGGPAAGAMPSVPGAPAGIRFVRQRAAAAPVAASAASAAAGPVKLQFLPEAVRLFTALAGLGAGVLTLGLSSNVLVSGQQPPAADGGQLPGLPGLPGLAAAVLLAAAAVSLICWSVQSLRADTLAWQRAMRGVLPAAVALELAVLIYGLWQLPVSNRRFDLTLACTIILELAILGCAGWLRRHRPPQQQPAGGARAGDADAGPWTKDVRPGWILGSMFISAVLVSAVATAGLAASSAGHFAVPHGEHGSHQPADTGPSSSDPQSPLLHDPAQHHH